MGIEIANRERKVTYAICRASIIKKLIIFTQIDYRYIKIYLRVHDSRDVKFQRSHITSNYNRFRPPVSQIDHGCVVGNVTSYPSIATCFVERVEHKKCLPAYLSLLALLITL